MSDYFMCLSMLVSGRHNHEDRQTLSARDCLAYAIERENDPIDLPPVVQSGVDLFQRIQIARKTP